MKVRLLKFFTILAMAVVLFAMVSCQDEVEPYRPEATIPSEEGGSATNFDDADAQVIQKVFTDLASLIKTFEESSKDVEKKTTVVANGSLNYHAANNTVHVNEKTIDAVDVDAADIRYTGFAGSATLTGNELTATINYSASFDGGAATAYKIVINDFELDEFELYEGDGDTALVKAGNEAKYYYATAVFMDAISHLQAEFENASVKITDEDDTVYDIDIAGSFTVDIEDFNLDAILGDDDGNPFTSGEFNIDKLILGIKVTFGGDTVNANIGMKNFNITVSFNDKEEIKGSITTTTSTVTIGFGYKELSIFANYGDFIVLNVESTDDRFDLDIVTIKEEDSSVVPSKKSSSTKFDVKFDSRVGIGLKVDDNAIGLLVDLGIDVKDKSFKELDLDNDLKFKPKAALVNGKYVNSVLFYECINGVIESMDAEE